MMLLMMNPKVRAAIYTRISLDRTGEGLGVDRQEQDAREIIEQRGWTCAGVWSDNSISASDSRKVRPGYNALVAAYDAGQFDALVCYDLDRLTRQPRQLEDWIDRAEKFGLALVTTNGEADLTTDGGRMYARIKAAVARAEIERKSARQKRAERQRAESGKAPQKGKRLTGYDLAGQVIEDEAAVVRDIFQRFRVQKRSLRRIAAELTEEGVPTRTGVPTWHFASVRSILKNPRYAGRVVYDGKVLDGVKAQWTPLIDPAEFDVVQRILDQPDRRSTTRTGRRHLGSGIYLCGVCDKPVRIRSAGSYGCPDGHVSRSIGPVDTWVTAVIEARLARDDLRDVLVTDTPDAAPLTAEADALRHRIALVEDEYTEDIIDGRLYQKKTANLRAQLSDIESRLVSMTVDPTAGQILGTADPVAAFADAELMNKRAVVTALTKTIHLHRHTRSKRFDPETVKIEWREQRNPSQPAPGTP